MPRSNAWMALGAGLVPLGLVVWAFFATMLPFATPEISHPWRGLVPFLALAALGLGLGYREPGDGVRAGFLCALPGCAVGGLLGLWAALRPADLFLLAVLVALFAGVGAASGWLGARIQAESA